MTTRQTPDAVREAIREDIAKQLDEPWRDRVILRPEQWQIVLAALDSRAGDAGEDIVELRAFLATYQDESDGDLVNRNPCDPLLTWGILRRIATPAPAVDVQEANPVSHCQIGSCKRHERCMYTPCRSATCSRPGEWDQRYRPLEYGEIIAATDECRRDDGTWVTGICVGQPAPDPAYTSHRVYRRLKSPAVDAVPAGEVERQLNRHDLYRFMDTLKLSEKREVAKAIRFVPAPLTGETDMQRWSRMLAWAAENGKKTELAIAIRAALSHGEGRK